MEHDDEEDFQIAQTSIQAIGERLLHSGWATRVLNTPDGGNIELTGKGIDGMDRLFEALRDLDPHTMQTEEIMGLFLFLTLRDEKRHSPPSPE